MSRILEGVKVNRREGAWVGKCSRKVYVLHIGVRLEVEKEKGMKSENNASTPFSQSVDGA